MFGFYDRYMKLFGLTITYYGLFVTLGMVAGILVACKLAKKRGLKADDILILACYVIPIAILGARLYYVIFSGETYSFLEFFKIWNGGLAVLGGVIGGIIAIGLYCLIHKKNFFKVTDIAAVALILGQAIGRIGCYFGGCCYGIEVTNDAFKWFPLSVQIGGVWHYSNFFYESLCCFVLFGIFLYLILKKINLSGIISGLYLIGYGTVRCGLESIRDNHAALFIGSVKVSQLLSGLIIVAGIVIILVILDLNVNKENGDKLLVSNNETKTESEEKILNDNFKELKKESIEKETFDADNAKESSIDLQKTKLDNKKNNIKRTDLEKSVKNKVSSSRDKK